jgi:riboflavin kinase/FMN adenylyltransferase
MSRIATIGFFDGVHKGHQFLFAQVCSIAEQEGLQPLIVTFDQHPRAVLQNDYIPQLITSLEERKALLQQHAEVLVLPFAQIQSLTAQQFMSFLKDEYDVQKIVMGYDHRFGSDRLSQIQDYRLVAQSIGVEILKQGEYIDGEWHVSSTEIRQALLNGNVIVANELLGRNYTLNGVVVRGKGIGRTIGFPTANIQPETPEKIIPKSGVYAVQARTSTSSWMPAILNIGTNPTIGNNKQTIELHIPHFDENLYGQQVSIIFVRYIREERKFLNINSLREQIKQDINSLSIY